MALPFFDQQAATFYPATQDSYIKNTVTPDTSVVPGYSPYQKGMLTILGQTLQSISSAFQGDNAYWQRQQKVDQEQYQADLEFKAKLMQQRMTMQENQSQKALRDAQTKLYNSQANYIANMPNEAIAPTSTEPAQPTLADAIKISADPFIKKEGVYGGKPSIQQVINPEYTKALELRNSSVKDVESFSIPLEKISTSIGQLREAIKNTPDFKPGPLSKPMAQLQTTAADMNNADWYKNYELSYNQNFLPLAQALNASKVLSDKDLENIAASLGDKASPKSNKLKALDQIESSISSGANSKLKAFGVDPKTYGKIFPGAYSTFIDKKSGSSAGISKDDPKYQAALKWYKPEEIDAYFKGKK